MYISNTCFRIVFLFSTNIPNCIDYHHSHYHRTEWFFHYWKPGGVITDPFAPMTATTASGMKSVEKVRTVFPETWLWTNSTAR